MVLDTIKTFRLEGKTVQAEVAGAITKADHKQTIEGASTLSLRIEDDKRKLQRSGLFSERTTAQVDGLSYELVAVRKQDFALEVEFEDLVVAALRRRQTLVKVAGNTVTRKEFIRRLVAEEPWVKFVTPPWIGNDKALVEMARGSVSTSGLKGTSEEKLEDTWTATGRLAQEVGWRRYVRRGEFWYLAEPFLFLGDPKVVLEEGKGPVIKLNWDMDAGQPVATMTAEVHMEKWALMLGDVVEVKGEGPADGKWLITDIDRSLFFTEGTVTLQQPNPVLPEPTPPPPGSGAAGPEGAVSPAGTPTAPGSETPGGPAVPRTSVVTGPLSSGGWAWPAAGTVVSEFGQRNGRLHAGVDIACPVGTSVRAAKAGIVVGVLSDPQGYGTYVVIRHDGDRGQAIFSRYAHLSAVECARGQIVDARTQIGRSGGARGAQGAGNSQGPHLHFEIRPNDQPQNPRRFLPTGGSTVSRSAPPV